MTCIVGIALNGEVMIGGDSAGTNSSSQQTIYTNEKVFFVRNEASQDEFLLGCGSSFRMMQLLRYRLKPPPYDGGDLYRYMVVEFVEAVREILKMGGFAKKEDEKEQGGKFLVGFRGRLFLIDSDYQVAEAQCAYNAIGSGDDLAIGSLFTTHQQHISPEERLVLALRASAYHNSDVREPFVIHRLLPVPVSPLLIEPLKQSDKLSLSSESVV